MERPKPKPLEEIDFESMVSEVIGYAEETLDTLDEGWNEEVRMNENEDTLSDNDEPILETVIKAIYGEEYWNYFNSKC